MIPTQESIASAHQRIAPFIHQTPVLTSQFIDEMTGCQVFFKCENFQKVGAFKARGAMNAVLKLSENEQRRGVATHSSGNHAQALARAAKQVGAQAYIVMPSTAPAIKKAGVLGYGGEIFECAPNLAARESTLAEVVAKTGAVEIHPFDNYDVIEGQATCAKEFMEEVPTLGVMMAPVGGGGLLSGTILAAKFFSPTVRVIAGEPAGADDAFRSLQSGKIEPSQANSVADGLLTSLGDKTFPIIKVGVERIITVSDSEIIAAMKVIYEKLKIVIEPSCAVPFAALLKEKEAFHGQQVGIILSGGNVDLKRLGELFV
jgi:threonine dehydratase